MRAVFWIVVILVLVIAGVFLIYSFSKSNDDAGADNDSQVEGSAETADIDSMSGEQLIDNSIIDESDDIELEGVI